MYSNESASKMEKAKYTLQQYKKFNGQTVMKALQSMDYRATSNKLAKYFAANSDHSEEDIRDTLRHVLKNAVANGFLITRGKSYQLPGAIQTDSRKKSALKPRRNATKKTNRSKPVRKAAAKKGSKTLLRRNVSSRVTKSKRKIKN